jgi:Fic family protein
MGEDKPATAKTAPIADRPRPRLPAPAPTVLDLLASTDLNARMPDIFTARIGATIGGSYPHWDEIRRKAPPAGLTRGEWWLGIKLARSNGMRSIPLRGVDGEPFRYLLTDECLEVLHWIDQTGGGQILVSEGVTTNADRGRYIVNSLIEEAITSSLIEGAVATRRVAKEMLRTGRRPRDRSERMIANNYRAMTEISRFARQPLTPDLVNDLHRILTEGTLDDPDGAGRPQRPGDQRVRVFAPDGTVVHVPPPADELPDRMLALCEFANGGGEGFTHPVIRAILLHLWLAYDHPYEDGNGRTARALFYWSMLSAGYWMFEYISISRIIYGAPAQYARAFQHTETDELDATYFVLHQQRVVRQAIDELLAHLRVKMREARETTALLRESTLNHRQVAMLSHALKHADAEYTAVSHSRSHRVTEQSARTDLQDLVDRGLLTRRLVGKKFVFDPVPDLAERLERATR